MTSGSCHCPVFAGLIATDNDICGQLIDPQLNKPVTQQPEINQIGL
jgi:hypothetical protein